MNCFEIVSEKISHIKRFNMRGNKIEFRLKRNNGSDDPQVVQRGYKRNSVVCYKCFGRRRFNRIYLLWVSVPRNGTRLDELQASKRS